MAPRTIRGLAVAVCIESAAFAWAAGIRALEIVRPALRRLVRRSITASASPGTPCPSSGYDLPSPRVRPRFVAASVREAVRRRGRHDAAIVATPSVIGRRRGACPRLELLRPGGVLERLEVAGLTARFGWRVETQARRRVRSVPCDLPTVTLASLPAPAGRATRRPSREPLDFTGGSMCSRGGGAALGRRRDRFPLVGSGIVPGLALPIEPRDDNDGSAPAASVAGRRRRGRRVALGAGGRPARATLRRARAAGRGAACAAGGVPRPGLVGGARRPRATLARSPLPWRSLSSVTPLCPRWRCGPRVLGHAAPTTSSRCGGSSGSLVGDRGGGSATCA